jgi:hypothetical protein
MNRLPGKNGNGRFKKVPISNETSILVKLHYRFFSAQNTALSTTLFFDTLSNFFNNSRREHDMNTVMLY